jgi:hypothetical protein
VSREQAAAPTAPVAGSTAPVDDEALSPEEVEERMAELREQLAATPVSAIVAQVAYQLFEVAALHLSLQPPQLDEARLGIDAMAAVVEGLGDRLGENAAPLRDGLTQIRLAFVQVQKGDPLIHDE